MEKSFELSEKEKLAQQLNRDEGILLPIEKPIVKPPQPSIKPVEQKKKKASKKKADDEEEKKDDNKKKAPRKTFNNRKDISAIFEKVESIHSDIDFYPPHKKGEDFDYEALKIWNSRVNYGKFNINAIEGFTYCIYPQGDVMEQVDIVFPSKSYQKTAKECDSEIKNSFSVNYADLHQETKYKMSKEGDYYNNFALPFYGKKADEEHGLVNRYSVVKETEYVTKESFMNYTINKRLLNSIEPEFTMEESFTLADSIHKICQYTAMGDDEHKAKNLAY